MDFTPNPIAFSVLGIGIRWYAILICAGILLASAIGLFRIKRRGISRNDYLDVILYSIPLGIIGARAWYVFFEWPQYHSVFDVINIRAGGLGIHGGMIVSMLTAFIVCRVKHISFLDCMDTAVPCAALAQAIGRWGNFFNQEAYGTVTNLPWAIVVNGNHVHPTFLYESIWCLFLFIFLSIKDRKKTFRGQTLTLYMILYSLERFFVEQLRVDSLLYGPSKLVLALKKANLDPSQVDGVNHFGPFLLYPFRTAQFVSLCAIALGLLLYLLLMLVKVKPPKKFIPAYDYEPVGEYYEDDYYTGDDYEDDVYEAETYAGEAYADSSYEGETPPESEDGYTNEVPSETAAGYAEEAPEIPAEDSAAADRGETEGVYEETFLTDDGAAEGNAAEYAAYGESAPQDEYADGTMSEPELEYTEHIAEVAAEPAFEEPAGMKWKPAEPEPELGGPEAEETAEHAFEEPAGMKWEPAKPEPEPGELEAEVAEEPAFEGPAGMKWEPAEPEPEPGGPEAEETAEHAFEEPAGMKWEPAEPEPEPGAQEAEVAAEPAFEEPEQIEQESERPRVSELKRQLAMGFANAYSEESEDPELKRQPAFEAAPEQQEHPAEEVMTEYAEELPEEEPFEEPSDDQGYYAELVFPSHTMEREHRTAEQSGDTPGFETIDFNAGNESDK